MADDPWIVLVELGGNDFLKGVAKERTEKELKGIVTAFQDGGAIVVLLGMDLGLFTDEYGEIYTRVAEDAGAFLIPSINRGILDKGAYRQEDRIHPNAAGHRKLAERLADELKPILLRANRPPGL